MNPIIYDVAVSIDGFISGPNGDISGFPQEGGIVSDYLERLSGYACAIMGRRTYEFGYRFGMTPGENPYPSMRTVVFSRTISLPASSEVEVARRAVPETIEALRSAADGPVYLCGGGVFAGALLEWGLIDRLRLKRAPALLGDGVRLFGDARALPRLTPAETRHYEDGGVFQEFAVSA